MAILLPQILGIKKVQLFFYLKCSSLKKYGYSSASNTRDQKSTTILLPQMFELKKVQLFFCLKYSGSKKYNYSSTSDVRA